MKKRYLALALLLIPSAALALSQSSIPPKFNLVWGQNAGASYIRSIPQTSQIGIINCAASLNDGFPPLTFVPAGGGGCPPFGQDLNGILKQLSQWNQWQSAGGPVFYDSTFASTSGGYPNGAVINSAVTPGTRWMSTADNNTTNPDTGGAGWVQDPGQVPIGTPLQSLSTTIPTGYVSANGQTIGNASSNATNRANADTTFLFSFIWANCSNTICPIYTSAGTVSTRGASAAADYAANKQLAVNNMNGAALIGADSQHTTTSSNLSGVPVTSGSTTVPGSIVGENLHSLTADENGTHSHGVTGGVIGGTSFYTDFGNFSGLSAPIGHANITISNSGLGTAHNTVPRSTIVYWNLKL